MTHKVYLITHLDNGMKYVGYTSKDLRTRWQQHCNDPKSAVYEAIRREGYRMTMELLGEFDTKIEALRKEQEYIRTLNTLAPNGWNVQEREIPEPETKPAPKKWKEVTKPVTLLPTEGIFNNYFLCPLCASDYTHHVGVSVYFREEDADKGLCVDVYGDTVFTSSLMGGNPSPRRDGIRINFTCENCHADEDDVYRPHHQLHIIQHKGQTFFNAIYYIEDES